jgi:2-dehydropantoate 2-reductase
VAVKTYAIVGTGAVGGYYGAKLARCGLDVHFLARGDYRHIRDHGLAIESKDGDFLLPHVNVYDDADRMPACDVVAVALKTTANGILPSILQKILKKDGVVLVMQNGLGWEERIAKTVSPRAVLGVLCFICVSKIGPGRIRHQDFGHVTMAQHTSDGSASGITSQIREIAGDFTKAGISVQMSPDLGTARWKKLVWNVPYSGLSVVLSAATDAINKNPDSRALAAALMEEVGEGARACGHPIEQSFVNQMLEYTDRMIPYVPSMRLDFDNRRHMEVESIFGEPVRAAQKAGAKVPLMEMLYRELKFLDEEKVTVSKS